MSVISTAAPVTTGAAVSRSRKVFGFTLVASTLFLIWWGGQVKSNEAGLSVPDWPKSYDMWWPPLVGNVYWEHLHRVIAAAVGLLTVIVAVWTQLTESRPWVRRLAWGCLLAVCVQGVLGGLNVLTLLFLPVTFAHSTLAQVFLCLVTTLAYAGSREGAEGQRGAHALATAGFDAARRCRAAAQWAAGAVFVQLILGVLVRHSEAGLAVPFFPVDGEGRWVPEFVNQLVLIHLLHRAFAVVVAVLVLRAVWRAARQWHHVLGQALLMVGLVVTQVFLGAVIVWSGKSAVPTSFHVVTGASLLAGCWLLVLRCRRAEQLTAEHAP